jgi:ParB family chromosome partitioning protein
VNGWTSILAIEHDADPEVAALIENLQRVDLTPVEEARGLQRLIEGKGWSQNEAAEALGKTKGEISATLRILSLPGEILEAVLTSELDIPRNALVELARIESPELRAQLLALAHAGELTVRAIRVARDAGEVGEDRAVDVAGTTPPATPRFSLKAIDRVMERLQAVHASGRVLDERDRKRLERLKALIEELLAKA